MYNSPSLHILSVTKDVTHGYWRCASSLLKTWLILTAHPYGYWKCDLSLLHTLTVTETVTCPYCTPSPLLKMWLILTAHLHRYWRCDSPLLKMCFILTEDVTYATVHPHHYWRCDSLLLKMWLTILLYTLTITAHSLYLFQTSANQNWNFLYDVWLFSSAWLGNCSSKSSRIAHLRHLFHENLCSITFWT